MFAAELERAIEYDPLEIQVLRLLKAFFIIAHPEAREAVVRMAEVANSEPSKVEIISDPPPTLN